jgi:hypothetical protein
MERRSRKKDKFLLTLVTEENYVKEFPKERK